MNISGIRSIGSSYNSISSQSATRRVSDADLQKINGQAQSDSLNERDSQRQSAEALKKAKAKQTFGIYDFDAQYKPDAKFVDEGQKLDVKALETRVSDIQKEELQNEYKLFVGQSPADQNANSGNVSMRDAENFDF